MALDLLIVPVPIFNKEIAIEAYYLRHQRGNEILDIRRGTNRLDGAMNSAPLEMLRQVNMDVFTLGKPIIVPIDNFMLLAELENQSSAPPDMVIFLLDSDVRMEEDYIANIARLKNLGYRFAIQKINDADSYSPVLKYCDYIFYDHLTLDYPEQLRLRRDIGHRYPRIRCVFTHIPSMEAYYDVIKHLSGWYEGRFYRVPMTKGDTSVNPLQTNLINLINLVRDENFEFGDVVKIIQKDPALTISMLRLVNSPFIGLRNKVRSISHAVVTLGQDEVRRWITTAVAKLLGSDKPNEITRLSLVRARFAENLSAVFGLKQEGASLFLMGLFSVLDAILEMPMQDALKKVHVSDTIYNALVNRVGDYYPVYQFMLLYEGADWTTVSRLLILRDLSTEVINQAYVDALRWYVDLMDETRVD
jgi:EAL and modified HD-GYP domain-containing signal transduction protein